MVNFDDLTSTAFEELCFDLLKAIGYQDLDWRKGSGINNASPADKGRDIEGKYRVTEPDGSVREEKWFFEIKHHKRGVPPTEISGAIDWAKAEEADCLVIVCSRFLSNPSKDFVELHRQSGMRIKLWENKSLESLLLPYPSVQLKHNLSVTSSVVEGANINHIDFALSFHILEVEEFIGIMNELDPDIRDAVFGGVYQQVINPYLLPATSDDQPLSERFDRKIDFESFRQKILKSDFPLHPFQVQSWILESLNYCRGISEKSGFERLKQNKQNAFDFATRIYENSISDEEIARSKIFLDGIERNFGTEEEMLARIERNRQMYNYICEKLLPKLVATSGKRAYRSNDLDPELQKKVEEIRSIYDRNEDELII